MRPEVAELFHILADLSPEAREVYFDAHPVDFDVRREVEELLEHDSTEADPLTTSVAAAALHAFIGVDPWEGALCGHFRLVRLIGRGGMGAVYYAERADGEVAQKAAVKLLHPGWSEIHRERFLREREILAALTHPNIAHLLDAGHLADGQPYFAMEYVEGKPIDQHCQGFTARQKIELFLKVCAAVEYLHRNMVAHRDLKPGNILVTSGGEPKLVDFGISRLLEVDGDHTATHLRMLTPSYASPEQVRGGVVGTSSDIYSLGAVLHTLLAGKPPQWEKPTRLAPEFGTDLDLVVQTALRQEPQDRYASAAMFANDLSAVLNSDLILARRGDRAYRWRKLARRVRVPAALTAAAVVALVSAGGLFWTWSRPAATPNRITPQRVTGNTPEVPIQAAAISPDGKWIAWSDPLGVHLRDNASGKTRPLPGTRGHLLEGWMPDGVNLRTVVRNASGVVETMLVSTADGASDPAVLPPDPWVVSPDGKLRASATPDGRQLLVESAQGGNSREVWKADDQGSALASFRWSPDARRIAVLSTKQRLSGLDVVDATDGSRGSVFGQDRKMAVGSIVWAGQKRIVLAVAEAAGVNSYTSNLWEARLDARGGLVPDGLRKLTAWTDFPILSGSLSIGGNKLAFVRSFAQRDVYVAGLDTSRSHLEPPRRLTLDLADDYPTGWTRDGRSVILSSGRNGPLNIFRQDLDKQAAEPVVSWPGTQLLPRVTPDGKSVLFCSIPSGQRECRVMRAPLAGGSTPEFVADVPRLGDFRCSVAGPCVVAQRQDDAIALHVVSELDLARGIGREIYRDPAGPPRGTPDISPDGKWLAAVSGTTILLRSFSSGAVVREIAVRSAVRLVSLDFAPDGQGVFVGDVEPTEARLFYVDLASGRTTSLWKQAGSSLIWGVPSPDGRHLAMVMYTVDANIFMVENF